MQTPYVWTRAIPLWDTYDVVVAGGGVAGVAAALAAARGGKKTLLLEREWALGGLATLGLIAIYLPLCDGKGHQVSFGICEELFRLAIKHGTDGEAPSAWLDAHTVSQRAQGMRMQAQYNPWLFALYMEQTLQKAGVTILYGTQAVGANVQNDRITALYVENKSGCGAIAGKRFIDCTGDADLCLMAGEETAVFERKNILASWYYFLDQTGVHLRILGEADVTEEEEKQGRTVKRLSSERFSGLDGLENSAMMQKAHAALLQDILARQETNEKRLPTAIATLPELRKTRRLVAASDMQKNAFLTPPDAVGVIGDWRKRGPSYVVPYAALYGKKIKNLAAAGRNMGAEDEMWELTRVIPACAVTGEAAGTAASLDEDFGEVNIALLQKALTCNGVQLDPERTKE